MLTALRMNILKKAPIYTQKPTESFIVVSIDFRAQSRCYFIDLDPLGIQNTFQVELRPLDLMFLVPISQRIRWILKILHDPMYLIPWELWYYSILRSCRIFSYQQYFTRFHSEVCFRLRVRYWLIAPDVGEPPYIFAG